MLGISENRFLRFDMFTKHIYLLIDWFHEALLKFEGSQRTHGIWDNEDPAFEQHRRESQNIKKSETSSSIGIKIDITQFDLTSSTFLFANTFKITLGTKYPLR